MIDEITIQAAKSVDINKVLEKFNWGTDITGTFILCPNPLHDDHNPSVSINLMENTCRCFTCRQGEGITFDTIKLYQSLSEKVDVRRVSFPKAVKEVLESVAPYMMEHPYLMDQKILERIVEPERIIIFRVPWLDDEGDQMLDDMKRKVFEKTFTGVSNIYSTHWDFWHYMENGKHTVQETISTYSSWLEAQVNIENAYAQ